MNSSLQRETCYVTPCTISRGTGLDVAVVHSGTEIFGTHKELECQKFHPSWYKPSVADHSSLLTAPILMERVIYTKLTFETYMEF